VQLKLTRQAVVGSEPSADVDSIDPQDSPRLKRSGHSGITRLDPNQVVPGVMVDPRGAKSRLGLGMEGASQRQAVVGW
jgi:hypothetical protein